MVKHIADPLLEMDLPDEWDLIPLGDCVTDRLSYGVNAPAIPYSNQYPCYIRITDITEDGKYNDNDKKSVYTSEASKFTLKEGDIVLARTGASTGKSYLYDKKDGELVYAGFLIKAAVDINSHNPKFIVGQLSTKRYWNWVAATSMRSGQPGINGKEYASFLVPVAPKREQDKIAEVFLNFDLYIANLEELIEKKRNIREGAVLDLVSGKKRLEGFNDDWLENSLGAIGDFTKGAPLSKADISASGTPMILYGELYTTYNEVTYSVYRHTNKAVDEKCLSRIGDVIIPTSGETAEDIATATCVMVQGAILAGDLNIYRTSELDGRFLSHIINHVINRKISEKAQGISIIHITAKELEKMDVRYPSIPEQKVIADIIDVMDEEIRNLEAELEKIMQIREGAMDDLLTGHIRLMK